MKDSPKENNGGKRLATTNSEEKTNSHTTVHHLASITSLNFSPTTLPLIIQFQSHWHFCWFSSLSVTHIPTRTHWAFVIVTSAVDTLSQVSSRLTPSPPSRLCLSLLKVSSERPTMTTLFNTIACPLFSPYSPYSPHTPHLLWWFFPPYHLPSSNILLNFPLICTACFLSPLEYKLHEGRDICSTHYL